jgi:hypothetical protein
MVCTLIWLFGVVLALPIGSVEPPQRAKPGLPLKIETSVRNAVYSGKLLVTHPHEGKYALLEVVILPSEIESAYKEHPQATLALLEAIIIGGNPKDSMLAASFAIALLENPAVASVVWPHSKAETYDTVDVDWKVTPRQHWAGKVKERIELRFRK